MFQVSPKEETKTKKRSNDPKKNELRKQKSPEDRNVSWLQGEKNRRTARERHLQSHQDSKHLNPWKALLRFISDKELPEYAFHFKVSGATRLKEQGTSGTGESEVYSSEEAVRLFSIR